MIRFKKIGLLGTNGFYFLHARPLESKDVDFSFGFVIYGDLLFLGALDPL